MKLPKISDERKLFLLYSVGSFAIVFATKFIMKHVWEEVRDEAPPDNPAKSEVSFGKALGWTLSIAALTGVMKLAFKKKLTEKLVAP